MTHTPVLLKEVLEQLDPHPGDFIIDGTVDGGNHAAAILEKILPAGKLLGVDWDERLLESTKAKFREKFGDEGNVILIHGNYADLPNLLLKIFEKENIGKADGLLIDLGFSSEQLESSGRGFSFSESAKNEPLLMTYSDTQTPVAQILREVDETELGNIIYEFGGERMSRRIAKTIKDYGRRKPIETSGQLADVVRTALPKSYERGRIDPATRTFQALRIYANDELKNLKQILDDLPNVLKPGGRAIIISFHSLEDRIVKLAFQKMAKEGIVQLLIKKPISATREEIKENPRSRSAKLRAVKMKIEN
jgi:16S rRNA (cytosine1402-N4)-methyltransferase